jgi:hypothetical protein
MFDHAPALRCYNCSRILARAVPVEGGYRLRPPVQEHHLLVRQQAGALRCARCGGACYLDPDA